MEAKKPIVYTGATLSDKLACCPNCDSNIDWTYETTILGCTVTKWRNGKRKKCIHCGQTIDWSDYPCDVLDILA